MNKEDFIKMYKNTKKEEIIEELFYKCTANYKLTNIIDELEKDLTKVLEDMYNSLVHIDGRDYYSASLVPLEDELNKLKELKEGK